MCDKGFFCQVTIDSIVRKLDADFFSSKIGQIVRHAKRHSDCLSKFITSEEDFTIQAGAKKSEKSSKKEFSPSHATQILASLADIGLTYENRFGKYSLASPLRADFIRRQ